MSRRGPGSHSERKALRSCGSTGAVSYSSSELLRTPNTISDAGGEPAVRALIGVEQ